MEPGLQVLLKEYENLPSLQRNIIDIMVVRFIPVDSYIDISALQIVLHSLITRKEFENSLKALFLKDLVTKFNGKYDVNTDLKLQLFPGLIQQARYKKIVKDLQSEYRSWDQTTAKNFRDFLYGSFVEENSFTEFATTRLSTIVPESLPIFLKMLKLPVYLQVLEDKPVLFFRLMIYIHSYNLVNFEGFDNQMGFIELNPHINCLFSQLTNQRAEMIFHRGRVHEAAALIENINNFRSLTIRAQMEFFRGEFASSIVYWEKARVTDEQGSAMPRIDFLIYQEFFYWLNYVFYPEGLNLKKLESFIKKAEKPTEQQFWSLVPLLYILKKDRIKAEEKLNFLLTALADGQPGIITFIGILSDYIIRDDLSEISRNLAPVICHRLRLNGQWLFLRELLLIMDRTGMVVKEISTPLDNFPDVPPSLMSRLEHQEKWEQMLDGLLNLTQTQSDSAKKPGVNSRVCYLVDMENRWIQPVLQTINAKGVWSSGRNIALKRLKEQQVDGLTEQDRRLGATIVHHKNYYSDIEYSLDFDKSIVELCGHPLLFLASNINVSVELIKAQPELVTEKVAGGIRIKSNIDETNKLIHLIRETQTRYKLIVLNTRQNNAIRMIGSGVTIPAKGKEKLLKVVSSLSSMMTVHSDITDETASARTVEADSRIRIQIVPIGDGLKAEMFVKPFGSEPPYLKPARGGKVVYGTISDKKCQTVRNMAAELKNANTLSDVLAMELDIDDGLIEESVTFSDPYQCLNLLETLGRYTDIAVVEWPEGEHFRIKKSATFGNLNLRIKGKGQWFELEGELNIDEETVLSLKELLDLNRKSKGRFIELKKGEFLALAEDLKKQLEELNAFATSDKGGVKMNLFAAHALGDLSGQVASFKTDKAWKDFQKRIKESETVEAAVPATLDGELRLYQEEGFRWMTRLNAWGAGACLADDMGLGKTIQAIALMIHLAENGPALVVCPASVLPNWGHELRKFAPTLNPVILKQGNREETFSTLAPFDVLITTYGLLQSEEERISTITWNIAILDEAHAIKNTQTKSSKAAMGIQAGFKLALTGTPIQNNLGELWNLFQFCNPGLLGSLPQFIDRYIKNDTPVQKSHLKKLIAPFILRRTKNKVLDELPPKTEITFSVELSAKEMAFYETLRREAIKTIENNSGPGGQQHLLALAEITKLRLACCNTALVNKEIELPSAKLEAFLEITDELRVNKHRALVFSQFVMHLSIVRRELDKRGITYQYLDGSTPIPERERIVKAFQSGKSDLFLISLKAGGLGLNLTAADYVLHLDPWWNPAVEDQASDRTHRIGQTRPVTIYRLVAKNTIEEKIVQLHATKRDLADTLLEGTDQSARLSTADLLGLLKEV